MLKIQYKVHRQYSKTSPNPDGFAKGTLHARWFWGPMRKHGTAGLHFLAPGTTMNGLKYVQLLQEKLNIHMAGQNAFIFAHDGAPNQRLKVVSEYLQKIKVKVLDWPENNPDTNPIENLWSYMKNKVAEKQPSSAKEVVEEV